MVCETQAPMTICITTACGGGVSSDALDMVLCPSLVGVGWIVRERLWQDLERHVAVELGISGSIHLAHPAFADLGGDAIRAEGGAGGKRH